MTSSSSTTSEAQLAPEALSPTASVSVVIPCYNEEKFIGKALGNLTSQYDLDNYEIVIVDGASSDNTRVVIGEFQRSHPRLRITLVDNPQRAIPIALNRGIAAAQGDIIARIDAHAVASDNYIRRCVEVLTLNQAEVVGMPCRVCPGDETLTAKAIAIAVSHPFGIGDARYRLGGGTVSQEEVDTVAFACFKKSWWRELGGFNEELLTNEDYDFNYRTRTRGGRVLLDRAGHCDYFARSTLSGLATQYLRYGRWKAQMVKLHPRSIRLRHLIAPTFVASIVILALLGFVFRPAWWLWLLELGAYFFVSVLFAVRAKMQRGGTLGLAALLPIVFFTIHVTWGASFLLGLFQSTKAEESK